MPPPQPKTFFGRDELVEEIINLAENLTPTALIGAGGIGKTSIALTVLHNDRIKRRFGENRRFIRCDQFPASRAHFLSRLSKVIGAGVENPEDLTSLRPFLSSREMIIFLDNAESILDPQGADAREIYAIVEELSQFGTICLCITSRISTVPAHCKRPTIQTLSMHAARDIFYGTYDDSGRPDIINDLLRRLDFHALSITLLATVASHNMWDYDRLTKEWDAHRTKVLRTDYNESLAATIELSLASPTFRELGPAARDLLGVVAFFPQGTDEKNLDWLFPTTSDRKKIFDKFCVLSLTYRSNGFITMLAPLQDYLCSKDPASSPLLCAAKERYFRRLSVWLTPYNPRFEEARWITSEDVNVEHLLVVFTSIDANSEGVWDACTNFIRHLYWHKRRLVVLGSRIEGLPDNHPSKPQCLVELSQLFDSVGIPAECKRLLTHALKLRRERGDDTQVALILRFLSDANRLLNLEREGIQQAEEALEIYERLGNESGQGYALKDLAWLLYQDKQLDAAEEAGTRAIDLLLGEGIQFAVCTCYRVLGLICCSKGEAEKATNHFEAALEIASSFNWHDQQFWCRYSLGQLFLGRGRFDDAHTNVELAKSHVANDAYLLGRAAHLKARLWCGQHRLEEAKSEASCAADAFERLGSAKDLVVCRRLLRRIEEEMDNGEPPWKCDNSCLLTLYDQLGVLRAVVLQICLGVSFYKQPTTHLGEYLSPDRCTPHVVLSLHSAVQSTIPRTSFRVLYLFLSPMLFFFRCSCIYFRL